MTSKTHTHNQSNYKSMLMPSSLFWYCWFNDEGNPAHRKKAGVTQRFYSATSGKKNSKGAPSNLHLTRKMAVNSEQQKQVWKCKQNGIPYTSATTIPMWDRLSTIYYVAALQSRATYQRSTYFAILYMWNRLCIMMAFYELHIFKEGVQFSSIFLIYLCTIFLNIFVCLALA